MLDLKQRIQDAFGGRLVVERELGGGGMSQVFLASATSVRRQVVVKVLPPELSVGVNAERFRREIDLAAQGANADPDRQSVVAGVRATIQRLRARTG